MFLIMVSLNLSFGKYIQPVPMLTRSGLDRLSRIRLPRDHGGVWAVRSLRARQARAYRQRRQELPPRSDLERRRGARRRRWLLRDVPDAEGQDARRLACPRCGRRVAARYPPRVAPRD